MGLAAEDSRVSHCKLAALGCSVGDTNPGDAGEEAAGNWWDPQDPCSSKTTPVGSWGFLS